jgi:hypothetical protein
MSHRDVETRLVEFLVGRGYPAASIVHDPEFKGPDGALRARPDLIIIDPATHAPLAVLEVKSEFKNEAKDRYRAQVESYAALFEHLPTFLVTGRSPSEIEFRRYNRESRDLDPVEIVDFPSLEALIGEVITRRQGAIAAVVEEQKKTSRSLHWRCYSLAGIAIVLAVVDFYLSHYLKIEFFNPTRLTLLGAAIGLLLIPYVQKFKGLGFEYERLTEPKKNA